MAAPLEKLKEKENYQKQRHPVNEDVRVGAQPAKTIGAFIE